MASHPRQAVEIVDAMIVSARCDRRRFMQISLLGENAGPGWFDLQTHSIQRRSAAARSMHQ
jgi:hypothetical protein